MSRHTILQLDPANYQKHLVHGENRTWTQTNCYTDLLIEQIHALGFEPIAALPFTLTIDFEGDQWTFFKFPHDDLARLYGLDIQELAIWRPLVEHLKEQVTKGNPVLVELDSYFLPDTSGTAYKLAHVKTTVSVNDLDFKNQKLGYFHNQGYFSLEGQDFNEILLLNGLPHDRVLPPYVEFIKKIPGFKPLDSNQTLGISLELLKKHLLKLPSQNPFLAFKERFHKDLPGLMDADISVFHGYSFATHRQYGACFELAQTYVRWLGEQGIEGLSPAADAFQAISQGAKTFQFQLARAMARRKELDLLPLDQMAEHWDRAMKLLKERFL